MPQVGHRTVMKVLLMGMTIRPNALLSESAFGIKVIWVSFDLNLSGLAQPLLMGVMIGPGKKLTSCLLAAFQHIAAVANLNRTKSGVHHASLVSTQTFCIG